MNEKIRQFSTGRLISEELDFYNTECLEIPAIDFLNNEDVIGKAS